jgi:hypothetical protein
METNIDKPKSAEEEDRAKRDLAAQERMAYWAKWMFWAAFSTVVLTMVGIFLIWRTLIHTRHAAEAARDMVVEGARATAAANTATGEAKRQADLAEESVKRLERPYIYIFGVHRIETGEGDTNQVVYSVANFGRTPARITILAAGMSIDPKEPTDPILVDYQDDPAHDLLVRPILPPSDIRTNIKILPPGGISFHKPRLPDYFTTLHYSIAPVLKDSEQFFVWIRIQYSGPLGQYMTNACWRFTKRTLRLVPWGEDQKYNGMI